jgi:hypothetical protein
VNLSRKRFLIALASGISLSTLFAFVEYRWPQSNWSYIAEYPGFVVAMFTVGAHGGMKPFNVVMIIANYIFYGLIGFAGYALFFRGNSPD